MQKEYYAHSEELIRSGAISQDNIWKATTRYGTLESVDSLIATEYGKSLDKNSINESFHWACSQVADKTTSNRSLALVRRFLSFRNGEDVDNYDPVFGTTLQRAVASGDCDFIQILIDHGEDIDGSGKFGGSSPLMVAVALGDVKAMRRLLDKGASLKSRGGIAGNLLQSASYLGHKEIVLELLIRNVNIDGCLDPWGSPLMLALQGNHPAVAEVLITRGANVKISHPKHGTALHFAAMLGLEEITKRLVEAGANVNTEGGKYGTALQAAAARGHRMIVLFLLDHGADVNIRGGVHGSALEAAQAAGDPMLVRLLLLSDARARVKPIFGAYFLPSSLPLEPLNQVLKKAGLVQ